jgi:hypothetical protein
VRGFRIAAFGLTKTLELEEGKKPAPSTPAQTSSLLPTPELTSFSLDDDEEEEEEDEEDTLPTMTPDVLADGTLLLDALGMDSRTNFIRGVCDDHLEAYQTLFVPGATSASNPNSFKLASSADLSDNKPPSSLDQIERRFAWFRRTLAEMDGKFPNVFPSYWNFQYAMTRRFLEVVSICWRRECICGGFQISQIPGSFVRRPMNTFLGFWMVPRKIATVRTQPSFSKLCRRLFCLKKK